MHPDDNQDRLWHSPSAAGPVSAYIRLPASKSVTNRALVLAALGGDITEFPGFTDVWEEMLGLTPL